MNYNMATTRHAKPVYRHNNLSQLLTIGIIGLPFTGIKLSGIAKFLHMHIIVYSAYYSILYAYYSILYAYIVYSMHIIVYSMHIIVYSMHIIVYSMHIIVYCMHIIVYSMHI